MTKSLLIPERTRSLLWITDELPDTDENIVGFSPVTGEAVYHSQVSGIKPLPYGDKIPYLISKDGSKMPFGDLAIQKYDKNSKTPYDEPSLIWTKLPVAPNNLELPKKPYYYPRYDRLSPEMRFQYLNWLRDITQPTYLSYVYLYFYGLERHLFLGDFENAVAEIKALLSSHDIGAHAYPALAFSCIARDRLDLADEIPGIYSKTDNKTLAMMALKKLPLTADVVIELANQCGFKNKKYSTSHSDLFKNDLKKNIKQREYDTGVTFFTEFDFTKCEALPMFFANASLTSIVCSAKVPDILSNRNLKDAIYDLLQKTATDVNVALKGLDERDMPKMSKSLIHKPSRQLENNRLQSIIAQLVKNRDRSAYANDEAPHKNSYIEYPYVSMDLTIKSSGKVYNQCTKRMAEIEAISKVDPEKSNKLALVLFNEGYRSPKLYERIAINYRKQNNLKAEVELLLQMKKDFGYDGHDERLRQALSKLEKRRDLKE